MSEITVTNTAKREFMDTPLSADLQETCILSRGNENFYGQADKGRIVFIPPAVKPGEEVNFAVKKTNTAPATVKLTDKKEQGIVDVFINEQFFTAYNYSEKHVRPFLFPVAGPEGKAVLRTPAPEGNPEKIDHKHHRGIWVAHGDTNGTDNWSEEPGHGRTIHRKFAELTSGPVFGRIHSTSDWLSNNGKKNP